MVRRVGFSILLLSGALGCKASVNAEARASTNDASASADSEAAFATDTQAEGVDDLDKPVQADEPAMRAGIDASGGGPPLLGARRDLSYAGPTKPKCSCLAVHLGRPNDNAFEWEKPPPSIDSSRQLVVALTSEGVPCSKEVGLGASYKGYLLSGEDVVVMVERAHEGRPITSGAVIPRPVGSGQVFVVAAEKGSPFGGAIDNPAERCQVDVADAATFAPASGLVPTSEARADEDADVELQEASSDFVDLMGENALGEDQAPLVPRKRDGFFLALHPTGSYLMLRGRDADLHYAGWGGGFDMLIGASVGEGFAVGVILGGATFPSPDVEVQGATLASELDLNLFHVGGFADYYIAPDSGVHLLAELAYARFGASGTRASSPSFQGLGMAVGLGYDWWVSDSWSLGLLGRFTLGPMRHQQVSSDHWLLLPGLNFTATYH